MGFSFPSFLVMKKKDNAYCDLEGCMYPFTNCSSRNSFNASSSNRDIGYTLQLIASGAPFLNSIIWSQGCEGGKHCDSFSLKTFANCWYCGGISTFLVYCPA